MKKHLIAAAVAAGVAVPAMAQNVTLSGYAEAGYQDAKVNGVSSSNATGGIFGSPRVVISESEDLGGGLKAGFRLESSINITTGQFGAGNTSLNNATDGSGYFDRGAEINLSGAFGMVRIGQFDHRGGEDTDLNVVGNIALATGNSNGNLTATGVEIGTDRKGTIAYRTPTMGGITFEVAHSTEDGQKATATTDSVVGAVQSFYAEGKIGAIGFRAGHATQAAIGAITAGNNDAKRTGAGVSYDFGVASASLHYATATLIDQTKNKETVASVKVPLSGSLDVRGAWRNFNTSNDGATTTAAADRKEYTIALANALSKRTTAYAAFTNFDRTSTNAVGNTDSKRVFLGVGHSF